MLFILIAFLCYMILFTITKDIRDGKIEELWSIYQEGLVCYCFSRINMGPHIYYNDNSKV